jgi:hypothetical protein
VLGNRAVLGGAALVASIAIKATAGLVLPFMVVGSRRRWQVIAGAAAAAAVIGLVGFALFGTALKESLNLAARHRDYYFDQSVPPHLAALFGLNPRAGHVRLAAEVAGLIALAGLLVWTAMRQDWLAGSGWANLAVLVSTTFMLAWYTIWVLPFAALVPDRRLRYAALALGSFVVASRLYQFGPLPHL